MIMFKPLGDSALLIQFGTTIDPFLNQRVHALNLLLQDSIPGVLETAPAYATLTVHYDPLLLSYEKVRDWVQEKLPQLEDSGHRNSRRVEVPVSYGGASGLDLEAVAAAKGISPADVIRIHSEREYTVYMMGFTPGFPYLGILDDRLVMPRMDTPRRHVAAGSVAIAGSQTGIYPLDSPGGWHILGFTSIKLFDPTSRQPFFFLPGDVVKFIPSEDRDA